MPDRSGRMSPRFSLRPVWGSQGQALTPSRTLGSVGASKRTISLILLVVQNSVLIQTMRYSRTLSAGSGRPYLVSTAVVLVEVIKLLVSLSIATYDMVKAHPAKPPSEVVVLLYRSICTAESWKLVIPAGLYTVQNYLVYVALSNMSAITFQATYQLKILTTALFSILLLGKNIGSRQWIALVLLTLGVTIVQKSESRSAIFPSLTELKDRILVALQQQPAVVGSEPALVQSSLPVPNLTLPIMNTSKGLLAVIAAAFISGLTCVYFEKLVKDSLASVSLWTRNIQLSFFSLFPAVAIGVVWHDGAAIARDGVFAGYTPVVWATIGLQALGGLLVALCITYADNVAKNFAASLSIAVSCAAGAALFMEPLTVNATAGTAIVLFAIFLYQSRNRPSYDILPVSKEHD